MSRRDDDLDEEIRAHLAMAKRDRMERGDSVEAAEAGARRELGSTALVQEVTREVWGGQWIERMVQDARYGLRLLRRSRGFACVAVMSLALGIGANTAIFTLVHALMLRPMPVKDPATLVEVLVRRGKGHGNAFSWQTFQYLRNHNQSFNGFIASHRDRFYTRSEGFAAQKIEGQYVTGDYFSLLGLQAAAGRLIEPGDDQMSAPAPVAVVSWAFWTNRLGQNPNILGSTILVEDHPLTIVGIAPREFSGMQTGWSEDLFVPLALEPVIRGQKTYTANAGFKWLQLVGRKKPEVSLQQIQAEMNVLFRQTLENEARERHESRIPDWSIDVAPAAAGLSVLRDQFSKPLLVLMAIVGMLLLIACANVAGMLLARGAGRQREMALRLSLGAGRMRLYRQLLTESLLLSGTAAVLGTLLAYAGSRALVGIMATGRLPIELELKPEFPVLMFTLVAAVFTAVIFGLFPALQAMRGSLAGAMRDARQGGETRGRRLFGKLIITVQVAFSIVMLSGASLFVRNLASLERRDIGIQKEGVLVTWLDASHSGYRDEELSRKYQEMLRRLAQTPGVRSASIVWMPPVSGGGADGAATIEGSGERIHVFKNWVAPEYFSTVGMPLLAGRDLTFQDDTKAVRVAIINQKLAQAAFGDASPLGRLIRFEGGDKDAFLIVGVAGDAKYVEIREATMPTVYLATFQQSRPASIFVIRTAGPAKAAEAAMRNEVREVLKTVLIGKVATLAEHIDGSIVAERLIAMLSALFGGLGLLLAALGLHGLLAYTVARRTNEIGIRIALGAERKDVAAMICREALLTISVGAAIGIPAAMIGAAAANSAVVDLPRLNLPTLAFVIGVIVTAGALSAFVPARRAARVNAMEALRHD